MIKPPAKNCSGCVHGNFPRFSNTVFLQNLPRKQFKLGVINRNRNLEEIRRKQKLRGVFRTLSKIYDGACLRKNLMALSR